MPTEPKLWRILDKFREELAAIAAGPDYHYTPTQVYVVPHWADVRLWRPAAGQAEGQPAIIYAVRRTDRRSIESATGDTTTGGQMEGEVDVHILLSQAFTNASADQAPGASQVLERMAADVLRRLLYAAGVTLGGLVTNVAVGGQGVDDTPFENAPEGWVAGEVSFRVSYDYPAEEP